MKEHRLFFSVDMDEWYFGRWATGSSWSHWPNLNTCLNEVYQCEKPVDEIDQPTHTILELLDSFGLKSTFFITGIIAENYPHLIKLIVSQGHEIASHNYHHLDYEFQTRERFFQDLDRSKKLLEDLSGEAVIGYRSPNSSIPKTLIEDVEKCGFLYDSSITPTHRIFEKFGAFTKAPLSPYHPAYDDPSDTGSTLLWEFQWSVFPVFNLPAGSGIMHRIMGDLYNDVATWYSLKQGHTSYYFHPWEIYNEGTVKKFVHMSLKNRLFFHRLGKPFLNSLDKFLRKYQNILVSGRELFNILSSN